MFNSGVLHKPSAYKDITKVLIVNWRF